MSDMMKLTPATLSTLNGGELEAQFQERLREALAIFAEPGAFQLSSGRVVVGVNVGIEICLNPQNNDVLVVTSCDLKLPKRQKQAAGMYLKGDKVMVMEKEQEQDTLPFQKPALAALPGAKKE